MGNQTSSKPGFAHPPATWTQSFPRESKKLKKYGATADTKVLPQRIPGQRLRPTENGHVLQTKGTITARKMSEFHAPPHPAFPQPFALHHALQHPHSASMTTLHYPHLHEERPPSMHDFRFGRPPSKNYASEPDLRGPSPPSVDVSTSPQPHTIISQSPTKGKIKSKKKHKAPPVPHGGVVSSYSLPRGAERFHSVGDVSQSPTPSGVHFAPEPHWPMAAGSPEPQKPKARKMGLFRKKNDSRRTNAGEEQQRGCSEHEKGRTASEDRRVIPPVRCSPREELRERARSLDCLQHELRRSPVSSPAVPVSSSSLTHLHQPQEPRLWATLERDSRRSLSREMDSRRSSTIERDSRKSARDSRRSSTTERDPQKSHRRMSTLERKVEERRQWTDGRENSTPSSGSRISRLDSYRDSSSHRRSSSSGSHHELIPEEVERRDVDEWDKAEAEMMRQKQKGSDNKNVDDWDKTGEQVTQRRKMSANLQAELIHTVKNLRKASVEEEPRPSTLTRKNRESERRPANKPTSRPSSQSEVVVELSDSQPKTFFFGMAPETCREPRAETNTGLHKIKNQEEAAKNRNREEVHITGQAVEYKRRHLERGERNRSRSARKENQMASPHRKALDEPDGRSDPRKLSRDVEEFAVAIERHKLNRPDGESGASGSSRREDGGYHSRQNSGSLYLDSEHDAKVEGELCMNLRPTLPRRQLEIPRFSPNAAWRSLSLERAAKQHPETLNETRSSEEPEAVCEARIQRFTRPTAPPRGSGEKSADSGISGDAGSPGPTHEFEPLIPTEKTKSSSGPLAASSPVASGRPEVRRTWTPAQDLDEHSLDSHGEQGDLPPGLSTPPKLTSRSNMFPKSQELTLDPETEAESQAETVPELVSPDKKDHWTRRKKRNGAEVLLPQKFNSLRRLKRSVSGAINGLGRKSPVLEDCHQNKQFVEPQNRLQVDESNWRDNWSMSRSIPNSLNTCEEQETSSNLSSSRNARSRSESRLAAGGSGGSGGGGGGVGGEALQEDSRSRTPSYLQYGTAGHIMYLPEYNSRRMSRGEGGSEDESERRHQSSCRQQDFRTLTPEHERKPPSGDEDPAMPESYNGPISLPAQFSSSYAGLVSSRKAKGKKFSYQSTVRILEKKKLEEKLTREVAEKEKLRLKEMEAMKKVEEEFQRKREREKKKVKQQLKLFHMQQQQQQQQQHTKRDTHNHSYSSDDLAPSSYSSEQNDVSSQASSQPPPLPRSPPPQVYPSFTSLPPDLPSEASPSLLSGLKSWVKGRKESRSSASSATLTSAPRQEPDGAPASSPRKISDDYSGGGSGTSSRKNSSDHSEQLKQNFRAEIIAASRKRNADNPVVKDRPKDEGELVRSPHRHSSYHSHRQEDGYHVQKHKHLLQDDLRRSQSPDNRRLVQELPEFRQERREYREYRSPPRYFHHSHSPTTFIPNSPPAPISPSRNSSNYRQDFCRGNAQVIGPNVVSVKAKRGEEGDRHSKHSGDDRRSVSSSGVYRSASADLLETGSCSSSSTARKHTQSPADTSLSHNYGRMNGYPVDSSPARFAHSILTPFNPVKGYRPVSFSPPPPTKILPVN